MQSDGKILVGGSFDGPNSIGGQKRNHIARIDATTGLAHAFNPNANQKTLTTAADYYNRGVARQRAHDLGGAIADFTKAIEIDPRYLEAYEHFVAVGKRSLASSRHLSQDIRAGGFPQSRLGWGLTSCLISSYSYEG